MERPGSVQFYDSIENEIKSKIPELTGAMKSGTGLPKDVATWLLIYHVDVEQKAPDVASGGAAQIALAALVDDTCYLDWPPCSTLLARLTENETCVEVVARLRASGRAAPVILLMTLLNHAASTHSRIQAAEAIVNMLEHSESENFVLGCLQGVVAWADFRDVLDNENNLVLKGCVAVVAMHLLSKSEAFVASVKATGFIGALLTLASQSRRDKQLEACFGCLAAICADKGNWSELLDGNMLRLATDVLGPPPPGYVMWEFCEHQLWRFCGTPRCRIQATCSGLLSVSTLSIPRTFNVSVRTQRQVVTCLNHLLQDPENGFLKQLSDLRAAYRLGRAMQTILASNADAGSSASCKAKKKGPPLDPHQINALAAITGVLKILTVNAACAFRVARTGCLPSLLLLKDHASLPLRRNCQMILSHTAYLKENEPYLTQLDIPEEYQSWHHLRLSDDEAAAVAIDFAEVCSKAAQTELQIHGHLFYMSSPEAQKVADEVGAAAAREA